MKKYLLLSIALLISMVVLSQTPKEIFERGVYSLQLPGMEAEAVKDFREAASQGYVDAEFALGVCYQEGKGVKKSQKDAIKWYKLSAEHGSADGQYALGMCYSKGNGVQKNKAEAAKWFRKAADGGDKNAQLTIAACYLNGTGVAVNNDEAVKYLNLASEQGLTEAQFLLGLLYYSGKKIPQDYAKAAKWLDKVARNDSYEKSKEAAYCMFDLYLNGKGVAQNDDKALDMYMRTNELDKKTAAFMIGSMYYTGDELGIDYTKSAKWLKKASIEGHSGAQVALGIMYLEGIGVDKSIPDATTWLLMASGQGEESATEKLKEMEVDLASGPYNNMFSINRDTRVIFAPGNLQYQASTKTWRFAENPWDIVGMSNNGWIDLYAWGTGNDPTSIAWDYMIRYRDFHEWGDNPISNSNSKGWRTLNDRDWKYLLFQRNTMSGIRFAKATVNGVRGVILLPDCWLASRYTLNNTNNTSASYNTNMVSQGDWTTYFGPNGAAFLPCTGERCNQKILETDSSGAYWTSSADDARFGVSLNFQDNSLKIINGMLKCRGFAVRLVRPAVP